MLRRLAMLRQPRRSCKQGQSIAVRQMVGLAALVLAFGSDVQGQGDTPPLAPTPDGGAAVAPAAVDGRSRSETSVLEERREWLRARYVDNVTSERLLRVINTRMDEMSEKDVNRAFLREQKKVAKQAAAEDARERAAARAKSIQQQQAWDAALAFPVAPQRAPLGWRVGDVIGLVPNVEWFPAGTQLGVGPGGIALQTGYPYTPYYHPFGCACRTCRRGVTVTRRQPQQPTQAKPEIWYDGLRTRRGDR